MSWWNRGPSITVTHRPTGIKIACNGERSLVRCKAMALRLLRSILATGGTRGNANRPPAAFGKQIRSYDIDGPLGTRIKDHRTGKVFEGDETFTAVMDRGELERLK